MNKTVKMNNGIRIWFSAFDILIIIVLICIILDKQDFNFEKIFGLILTAFLTSAMLVYSLYLFSFKIMVYDNYFTVRLFFKTRICKITDITDISYKRITFGDYTYVVRFGKRKMEVSPLMKNKRIIDKKLQDNGIFEKYPRVSI